MACSECGADSPIVTAVPDEYREYAPDRADRVAICPRCLTVDRARGGGRDLDAPDEPDFSRISDAFPTRTGQAIPLALAIHLCSSLATNRTAIESLLEAVEREGVDPLLAIDRLRADPTVDPAMDLDRRQHQLEQLLY
ncbi:DUF6276 family protein [Halosolutus gelatinilyticus]|uniref:DUF6276 family protein n=1 Tax=Halosolutus gelatinilyticus TaxID=2931975 RepID=UPI001FF66B2C|nr:DUF6276 family protein [Halosolutus gelatinilyticus]